VAFVPLPVLPRPCFGRHLIFKMAAEKGAWRNRKWSKSGSLSLLTSVQQSMPNHLRWVHHFAGWSEQQRSSIQFPAVQSDQIHIAKCERIVGYLYGQTLLLVAKTTHTCANVCVIFFQNLFLKFNDTTIIAFFELLMLHTISRTLATAYAIPEEHELVPRVQTRI